MRSKSSELVFRVSFLADQYQQEVHRALETFSGRYCLDWKKWTNLQE
jgi:hypothetical protein